MDLKTAARRNENFPEKSAVNDEILCIIQSPEI
jgi:hypothetical protein